MSNLNRRQWIQKSLLATSGILVAGQAAAIYPLQNRNLNPDNGFIRLNWNENPYGPSPKALKAMMEMLQNANYYPDDMVVELKNLLATKYAVESDEIMITAGSTEILSLLGQHVGLQKGEILLPWPSFPTIVRFGERCGASIRKVSLDDKHKIDLDKLLNAISDKTQLLFVCNPNNPTSTEVETEDLKSFCRAVPKNVIICVDEAYIEYSQKGVEGSMVSLVKELPNLVICRTFSKAYGLAGLRIGYAISHKDNIKALLQRHTGWELSVGWTPLVGAKATLEDPKFLDHCVQKNREGRKIVYRAFDKWGVEYSPSSTSFIYAKADRFVADVRARLKEDHILITKWPGMKDHIRISISKPKEMEQFVAATEKYLI